MTAGIIIVTFIAWAFSSSMLYLGASIVNIPTRTFGKALQITAIVFVVQFLCSIVFNALDIFVPNVAVAIGALLSFILGWWITKNIFTTTWIRAMFAIIFSYLLTTFFFLLVGTTFFVGMMGF